MAKPFLISFFQEALNTGWLKSYIQPDKPKDDAEIINWDKFPFEKFYDFCTQFLYNIQGTRPDYINRQMMFTEHHITPRFEGGSQAATNRVLCHRYEHGLVHLFRWLYTNRAQDLGGFTSSMLTEETALRQRQQRQANPPVSPLPPRPQANRPSPTITGRLIQSGRQAGQRYQRNSRVNADPFGWFVGTMPILFVYTDNNITYSHPGSTDILSNEVTASVIGRKLHPLAPECTMTINNPQSLSQLLKGEVLTRGGWSIKHVDCGGKLYQVRELKQVFEKVYDVFRQGQTETKISRLNESLTAQDIKAASLMFDFLKKRQSFLTG